MTERNSHLAGATTGTSIANGSYVETERPNELRQVSLGGGRPHVYNSVAGFHLALLAAIRWPWRPYFKYTPRIYLLGK